MRSTRRRFVRDCSALAAAAVVLPHLAIAVPRRLREMSLADVSYPMFAAQVHTRFGVRDARGNTQALELVEARLAAPVGGFSAGEFGGGQFTLSFRGEAVRRLQQDTYAFDHARLGRFPMFIVPVGREAGRHCFYEAVFNRLPPEVVLRAGEFRD